MGKIIKPVRDEITAALKVNFMVKGILYSYTVVKDDLVLNSTYEDQPYKITIQWAKSINQGDMELYSFYSLFFKLLTKKMNFQQVRRNCFNPKAAVKLNQYNLEVWPGFYSAMQKLETGPLI